jgi:hypothetical protein
MLATPQESFYPMTFIAYTAFPRRSKEACNAAFHHLALQLQLASDHDIGHGTAREKTRIAGDTTKY